MKKILVTGGAGFIGHHLCRALLDQGHSVFCLDDFSTGTLANIEGFCGDNFQYICWDIEKPLPYIPKVDEIYHLACPASPVAYQRDPIKTIKTCVMGADNILRIAQFDKAKVLLTSTSEVYGDPLEHPQKESYWGNVNPNGIRACYDEGKRIAETLFIEYRRQYGVETRIARIFNTYGPGMQPDDGRVISNFITQALAGGPLTIHGDGSQTRSCCYVDDMVKGLMALMASGYHDPVNLGNPEEETVRDIAQRVRFLVNPFINMTFTLLPEDDPKRRRPDITRAKEILGWKPETAFNEGLRKTIEYFKNKLDGG